MRRGAIHVDTLRCETGGITKIPPPSGRWGDFVFKTLCIGMVRGAGIRSLRSRRRMIVSETPTDESDSRAHAAMRGGKGFVYVQ